MLLMVAKWEHACKKFKLERKDDVEQNLLSELNKRLREWNADGENHDDDYRFWWCLMNAFVVNCNWDLKKDVEAWAVTYKENEITKQMSEETNLF